MSAAGPAINTIAIGTDGFYHPTNEEQVIALVKKAYAEGLQVRCRGASHSTAWAIYTDPGAGDKKVPNKVSEQNPPQGPNINIMLDQYYKLEWLDKANGIIEVEAGIHLGYDPEDPTHTSTLENSLLYQAFKEGWALEDLGGITHQTVAGFLSTGSSGGTLMYKLEDNLLAFRVIDGEGHAEWIKKDRDADLFNALGVSLGLLGIISRVRFKLTKNFYIYGQQITTPTEDDKCPIDLFGPGITDKPSMREFLEKTPYTRILWWPQNKVERVVIWEAVRGAPLPVFDSAPYEEFADTTFFTELEELGGALLFTLLGNRGFFKVWWKLQKDFGQFRRNIYKYWETTLIKPASWIFSWLVTIPLWIISLPLVLFFSVFPPVLRLLYPAVVDILQPLTKNGKAQLFMDYMWRSLPMDDNADDILMGTEFTEIWIPLEHTQKSMQLLKELFDKGGYDAQGYYSTELYAGIESSFWLSPAYGGDVFRVDVFWYINNEGNPAAREGFYSQFWELFRGNDVPFRLHWGKFLPEYDYQDWAVYLKSQYARWNDFMKLRAARDPKNIFLSTYWRRHLFGE
ncbi:MAG TPA: D-arabinono-1,4-lactone oxidase [Blastocatellia bacterium]|nr:D-arabinono-1,4-lactone oxidase [Blastocatellia bacterium]